MSGKDDETGRTQPTQSSGTGGAGNTAQDKAPQPTSKAPFDTAGETGAGPSGEGAEASRGVGSGLQPGGTAPSNENLAGPGRVGAPGAHAEPGSATRGQGERK
jgi:hypothetical protein